MVTQVGRSPSTRHGVAVGAIPSFNDFFELHNHINTVVKCSQNRRLRVGALQGHVLRQHFVPYRSCLVNDRDDLLMARAVATIILDKPVARHRVAVGAVASQRVRSEDDFDIRTVVGSCQNSGFVGRALQGQVARQRFIECGCLIVFNRDDLVP